jgi:GTPase SAR1 family protein
LHIVGQEDYDNLRPLSYENADVFIACFSLVGQPSLVNIEEKWIPDLTKARPKCPIILVGLQEDRLERHKAEQAGASSDASQAIGRPSHRPENQEQAILNRIRANPSIYDYRTCSAMQLKGVKEVFDAAVSAVLAPKRRRKGKKRSKCSVL